MYDWTDERIFKFIDESSKNNFVLIEFSYKQLGRSEEWFKKQCKELNYDLFKIKREILLEWNSASDKCPYTEEQIMRIKENTCDPVFSIYLKDTHPLKLYRDIDFSKSYFISCDVAAGLDQDSSTIIVSDPDNNMELVGEYKNNSVDIIEFTELIYILAKRFIREGPIVIERNSYGKTAIDFLRKTDMEPRLYYELKEMTAERKISTGRVSRTKQITRVYGVNTDKDTRKKMLDLLTGIVNENYEFINSPVVADEIAGLERKPNGKIEHGSVSHDDCVMAYLFAHYVWAYGTNLNAFYIYKTKTFGDLKSKASKYDALDRESAEMEYINRFNSIALHNKSLHIADSSITAQSIIDDYMQQQQIERNEYLEKERMAGKDSTLTFLNNFYNNNY